MKKIALLAMLAVLFVPEGFAAPKETYTASADAVSRSETFKQETAFTITASENDFAEPILLAQNGQTFDEAATETVEALNIPVDTVESLDEIADTGTYFIKNPPDAGAGAGAWVSYILAVLGFLFGAYQYLKRKWAAT